jgi:hypothetical protein
MASRRIFMSWELKLLNTLFYFVRVIKISDIPPVTFENILALLDEKLACSYYHDKE